ncbi:MAG: Crp/Fnr family transcriptional regulator [Bacteroidales bacterium]|nr:Crp/Fnr family transcriptional regulator [Bacteroidales bacterium]
MKTNEKQNICVDCAVNDSNIFKYLTDSEKETLDQQKHCNIYRKGDIIYHEKNRISGCYCVVSGIIKIYKTGIDGKEQIIDFAKKGNIIGFRSVLSNEPACTSTKVIEDCAVCFIPSSLIFQFIQNNPSFSLNLLKLICKELETANSYITDIAQKTVRERLAEILLKLNREFGVNSDGFIQINLSREELANMVGTATESVIRLLSEFKNEKLIELQTKKIKLLEVQKLKALAKSI